MKEREIKRLLLRHFQLYPKMQAVDAVKLLYQNAFGPGHIVSDESAVLKFLESEFCKTESFDCDVAESIGNDYVRLSLAGIKKQYPPLSAKTLGRLIAETANLPQSGKEYMRFRENIEVLYAFTEEGSAPFSVTELQIQLKTIDEGGLPPRHSEIYRDEYYPAYRIVTRDFASFLPVFSEIDRVLHEKGRVLVGVDGRCTAGKSTLADELCAVYDAGVIHLDDFFLPSELRTSNRFDEPGGNVDYERFLFEVAHNLKANKQFYYRVFDCSMMDFCLRKKEYTPKTVNIVEGSYSHRADFRDIYDLTVFLTVDKNEQRCRIERRNGKEMAEQFLSRWIPLEEKYFSFSSVEMNADIVIDTSGDIEES